MDLQDWKDKLGAAFNLPAAPSETETPPAPPRADAVSQQGKVMLDVLLDKRGKGKHATIITGFKCDEEALKELAAELKRACGVGGSARGGEILIQGDCRQKVYDTLTAKGMKVKKFNV